MIRLARFCVALTLAIALFPAARLLAPRLTPYAIASGNWRAHVMIMEHPLRY